VEKYQSVAQIFSELYDLYFPQIYNYIFYRVKDKDVSYDLTSTVFEKALRKITLYQKSRGNFSSWLFRIANNVVVDYYRLSQRRREVPLDKMIHLRCDDPTPEDQVQQQEEINALLTLLASLSQQEQDIIAMKFAGGLTNKEIASILGLKANHVGVILY